jgi:hypothetical protein
MLFLEVNDMPITPDGHFLTYKAVTSDYKDFHTGKFDNSIGAKPEMPRHEVDDNRAITCSRGLHAANKDYASSFGGTGHLMVCKVNPKDVVSIPNDYNNAKMRVSKYEVIDEVPKENKPDKFTNKAVHYEEEYDDIVVCDNCGVENDTQDVYCYECGYIL